MVNVFRVGSADAAREVEKGIDLESGRWGLGEEFGNPVVKAVAVAEEAGKVSDDGVGFWTWVFGCGRFGEPFGEQDGEEEEE